MIHDTHSTTTRNDDGSTGVVSGDDPPVAGARARAKRTTNRAGRRLIIIYLFLRFVPLARVVRKKESSTDRCEKVEPSSIRATTHRDTATPRRTDGRTDGRSRAYIYIFIHAVHLSRGSKGTDGKRERVIIVDGVRACVRFLSQRLRERPR